MEAHVLAGLGLLTSAVLLGLVAAGVSLPRRRPSTRAVVLTRPVAPASAREIGYLERLISDEADPEPVLFRVTDVVLETVTARRAVGLTVDVFSRAESATGVPGDLATALDNLLHNAHVHGRGRGVVVETSDRHGFVELLVSDAGPGVPDALRRDLFDPGAGAGRRPAPGLGLHISRNLLRAQGGDLELRDSEQGAAFVARIPAQRPGGRQRLV